MVFVYKKLAQFAVWGALPPRRSESPVCATDNKPSCTLHLLGWFIGSRGFSSLEWRPEFWVLQDKILIPCLVVTVWLLHFGDRLFSSLVLSFTLDLQKQTNKQKTLICISCSFLCQYPSLANFKLPMGHGCVNRVGKRCVLLALESHYAPPLAHHWVPESKVSPISISPENKLLNIDVLYVCRLLQQRVGNHKGEK